ncbi:prolipoprotein diacylglyceryl transferase [Desulfovibrio inopinatus]|uniref:prolipoprotein diacylglyceryl transferase n=1 Tax=Desulfovibrio inopinatus TaxID=102109 RepID=UPI00041AABDC|nr:prolipoprotein diacylglyceryl transferase [Desulfovibrio inopinatus]
MIIYPQIDPTAISIGPLHVRWYGLMYLIGFLGAWMLGRYRASKPESGWTANQVDDLITYCVLGVVVGGRFGYIFFYDLHAFLQDPLVLFKVWQGGMSFHGGAIGVAIGFWLFGRKTGKTFFTVADFIVPLAPLGLFAGRIGNFINAELWGKPTDLPWGVVFPGPLAGGVPRHPSQLYEASLEGLVLFTVLWLYSSKPRPRGAASGLFLLLYGCFRFLVEFVREPDAHIGYIAFGWLTEGQILSFPMIILGIVVLAWSISANKQRTTKSVTR